MYVRRFSSTHFNHTLCKTGCFQGLSLSEKQYELTSPARRGNVMWPEGARNTGPLAADIKIQLLHTPCKHLRVDANDQNDIVIGLSFLLTT